MNPTLARLTRLVGNLSRESDGSLLAAFVTGNQHAFRELVERHGTLVFGVCNRILRHQQDAEDAFQAVFIVLARRAADVWPRDAIGSWLYGVASRVALKARILRDRRLQHEGVSISEDRDGIVRHEVSSVDFETVETIDRAVRKLPEVYRAAVVACDLQGLSRKDAAGRLGWTEGTLSGRLALITGANGGIGQAIVSRLVAAGTAVAALDRDPAVISLAAVGTVAAPVHPVVVDLADVTAARAAVGDVLAQLGPVDVLINNAGVMHKKQLPDHALEDWDLEMAVNARAPFILCQALVPAMAVRGFGIVINVASIWASRGGPERAAYIASKHALLGLTRALAAEYVSAGVRINAVSPGPVRTPMTAGLGGDQSSWMEPDEVAGAVEFLCGASARGISGENIEVLGRGRPAGL